VSRAAPKRPFDDFSPLFTVFHDLASSFHTRPRSVARESVPEQAFDRGFDGHARRQAVAGLALTPAERLAWLEETMATFRRWLGRARDGRPLRPS
jgi:hypothetical protein